MAAARLVRMVNAGPIIIADLAGVFLADRICTFRTEVTIHFLIMAKTEPLIVDIARLNHVLRKGPGTEFTFGGAIQTDNSFFKA
jgi:hypothetical protein